MTVAREPRGAHDEKSGAHDNARSLGDVDA
jgi:hypothetical protein